MKDRPRVGVFNFHVQLSLCFSMQLTSSPFFPTVIVPMSYSKY